MKLISGIRALFNPTVGWWSSFSVASDETGFTVTELRLRSEPVSTTATWHSIRAICFVDGGLGSDCFYSFVGDLADPILVPVESAGGLAFWETLKQRELFPPAISVQAVQSVKAGTQLWWPPEMSANNSFNPMPLRGTG